VRERIQQASAGGATGRRGCRGPGCRADTGVRGGLRSRSLTSWQAAADYSAARATRWGAAAGGPPGCREWRRTRTSRGSPFLSRGGAAGWSSGAPPGRRRTRTSRGSPFLSRGGAAGWSSGAPPGRRRTRTSRESGAAFVAASVQVPMTVATPRGGCAAEINDYAGARTVRCRGGGLARREQLAAAAAGYPARSDRRWADVSTVIGTGGDCATGLAASRQRCTTPSERCRGGREGAHAAVAGGGAAADGRVAEGKSPPCGQRWAAGRRVTPKRRPRRRRPRRPAGAEQLSRVAGRPSASDSRRDSGRGRERTPGRRPLYKWCAYTRRARPTIAAGDANRGRAWPTPRRTADDAAVGRTTNSPGQLCGGTADDDAAVGRTTNSTAGELAAWLRAGRAAVTGADGR
jgi:hypothetical protein